MESTIKKYKELPFEIDKVYKTKFQTGESVTLKKIYTNKQDKIIMFGVIYENSKHLGICPLGPDRLIADKIEDGEVRVCSKCGDPF